MTVTSIGIIIGVVLGLAGIIWFFVSLIIEQKDIKTEIRVINQTIDTQTDSLQKLSENIEDLDKDYNSDFKVVINRILDKVDILIQKK